MLISFRSKLFDAARPRRTFEDYYGEDLARWLSTHLAGWTVTYVGPEDWGWAVAATKGTYRYLFGVYDLDVADTTDDGPRWVIRIYNRRDRTRWFRKLFKHIPPIAHDEVVQEIVQILRRADGITDIATAPLDP